MAFIPIAAAAASAFERLRAEGIVRPEGRAAMRFDHALIHQAAYARLTDRQRGEKHHAAARACLHRLEAGGPASHHDVLRAALHLTRAATTLERKELAAAAQWLVRAQLGGRDLTAAEAASAAADALRIAAREAAAPPDAPLPAAELEAALRHADLLWRGLAGE